MAAHLCTPCVLCGTGCGDFWCPDDRPSPLFTTFSVVLNAAYAIWNIIVVVGGTCESRTRVWSILGLVTAVVNIAFAFYLYFRFAHKARKEGSSASKAACKILLYDWGVCVYFLVLIWIIVWMVLAGQYKSDAPDGDDCADMLVAGIVFFIVYLVAGTFVIALSLMTECCREPTWKRRDTNHPHGHHNAQQQPQRGFVGRMVDGVTGHHPQQQQQQTGGYPHDGHYPQHQQPQQHRGFVTRIVDGVTGHHPHAQPTAPQPTGQQAGTFSTQAQYGQPHLGAPPARNPNYQV